jgi:DNA-binding GntR family transcriptional regulator
MRTAAAKTAARKKTAPAARVRKKAAAPVEPQENGFMSLEPRTTLTDLAYQKIEEAIVTLRIPPGSAISEQALSTMTGIGRTPIREAIQRLAREHLIMVLPQRGLLVTEMDVAKQLRLLEMRREIERLVARGAAKRAQPEERANFVRLADEFLRSASRDDDLAFIRADREFNELCLQAARNEFADGAMRLLHGVSRRFWYMHYKLAADMPVMARLHAAVANAIAKGNPDAAGKALDKLLDNLEDFTRTTVLAR